MRGQGRGGAVDVSSCEVAIASRLVGSVSFRRATSWRTALSWMRIDSTSALKAEL